ncbi:TPA: modification methylase, partial [Candidatus Sumerlaeota bacterium]|nr:modification methylase [Candidatus Sumerlaeota bacterium]
ALARDDGPAAFEAMHRVLDKVWDEMYRVLIPGGFICINIGDATRTLAGNFQLYANHARILQHCLQLGFCNLPAIIWRKQTNAPNKFMGSGMLPAGAYVTLEHEYILVLRKGKKRAFASAEEKALRQESAFFWEERNAWFSDVWFDIKGSRQKMNRDDVRTRSGAFPFEVAHRLVCMYSVKGDTVLDPFGGTGTTALAAVAAERNSVLVEIDPTLTKIAQNSLKEDAIATGNATIETRLKNHRRYVEEKGAEFFKYQNEPHGFPVKTRQEKNILLRSLCRRTSKKNEVVFTYATKVPNDN